MAWGRREEEECDPRIESTEEVECIESGGRGESEKKGNSKEGKEIRKRTIVDHRQGVHAQKIKMQTPQLFGRW